MRVEIVEEWAGGKERGWAWDRNGDSDKDSDKDSDEDSDEDRGGI